MAFYTMDISEEKQIMGRASRYGDRGSFKIIAPKEYQCSHYSNANPDCLTSY